MVYVCDSFLQPLKLVGSLPAWKWPANKLARGDGPLDAVSASKPAIFCWLARTDLAAIARQPHFCNHDASRQRRICHHHRRRSKGGGLHPDGLPVLRCVHHILLFLHVSALISLAEKVQHLMSHSSPHLRDAHLPVVLVIHDLPPR